MHQGVQGTRGHGKQVAGVPRVGAMDKTRTQTHYFMHVNHTQTDKKWFMVSINTGLC
jgi:hypothetical protein